MTNRNLTKEKLEYALKESLKKIDFAKKTFVTTFPSHNSINNVYTEDENIFGWNEGFWTGILWIAYELTGNEDYKKIAMLQIPTYTRRVRERLDVETHDMGFLYSLSCVAAYKLTGDTEARDTAVMAADCLMERYHTKGDFLQAWGKLGAEDDYRLIIDCLLNIPLLYWASEVTGDDKYAVAAFNHFNTTCDNIMREDGSTYHTFFFDLETGAPLKGVTHQGASDDSCWSRGQAWGIYGTMLTLIYRENNRSIPMLKKMADYFLDHLPADKIPYWDLFFDDNSGEAKDSSSAAIAICGLLEAVKHLPEGDSDKERYYNAACEMMTSLIDGYMTADVPESNGILLHAVYVKPVNKGVDECNIWGDYFFMEALIRFISDNKWNLYW